MATPRPVRSLARRLLHPIVPAHYHHPLQLAGKVVRSRQPAAWFAAASAALTVVAAPLDVLLQGLERRLRQRHPRPNGPVLIVCGPPRSGTTLTALTMIRALPVTYITNLMAMFPRSPVTASRLLSVRPDRSLVGLGNYYGRTAGFRRPNDALPMWDRWLGADRTVIPTELGDEVGRDMRGLFGTLEAMGGGRPVLAKNNGLNAAAHLVGDVLPTAHFVCMDRDPVFLAQSLLQARRQIHGDDAIPYGLHGGQRHTDPVDDVVSQVCWHRELAMTQQAALGADRFWRVSYEAFCADPAPLVDRVAREVLDVSPSIGDLPTLQASRRVTLESDEFDRLERRVKEQVL